MDPITVAVLLINDEVCIMQIQENISLRPFHTFNTDVSARYFASFRSIADLQEILKAGQNFETKPAKLILGGGSNVLFTKDFDGLVLKNEITGIEKINEDDDNIFLRVGAGENWHRFVMHCVENGYGGVENLSLIPGCVGASPMQNIGAYGVELREVFHELTAFHLQEQSNYTFRLSDCEFGYRDSVFKNKYKDQFVISYVTFRLTRHHVLNTSYGAIEQELQKMGVSEVDIRTISQAVINIRTSKLPDPAVTGNAGSFFKNPSVDEGTYLKLKEEHSDIPGYKNEIGTIKLAAGWLIEKCGWKGYRKGDAGVHPLQALVLVNYQDATGKDIYDLSTEIAMSVLEKFGVALEREVNVI